jgi:outer membrane protein OmpA-like peptidoglycan-associated protein
MVVGAALLVAAPFAAQAQSLQPGGVYVGLEGGLNWMFNSSFNSTATIAPFFAGSFTTNASWNTGYVLGGTVGYDFIGPRVELEGAYRANTGTLTMGGISGTAGINFQQINVMGNIYYDFMAGGSLVPYIGAGAGVAFLNAGALGTSMNSTQFAYQAMVGVGYNLDSTFRINLEGRYMGTTTPNFTHNGTAGGFGYSVTTSPTNNNVSAMLSLQMKFGAAPPPPPPPPPMVAPPSFMVFFDWDRSNLSQQALNTIKQAAAAFKSKGNARITATGHTDTSGPEAYNMALSLRRANAVKDALVREGVPAQAITVIGRGEAGLLVQTADGVREPQNRRVEIVIQ